MYSNNKPLNTLLNPMRTGTFSFFEQVCFANLKVSFSRGYLADYSMQTIGCKLSGK